MSRFRFRHLPSVLLVSLLPLVGQAHLLQAQPAPPPVPRPQPTSLADLIAQLDADDPRVRHAAIRKLRQAGASAGRAVPRLLELTAPDQSDWTRLLASEALLAIRPGDAGVVRTVAGRALATEWRFRDSVVEAIGLAGPNARPAVPSLILLLHDADQNIQKAAYDALTRIGVRPRDVEDLLDAMERGPYPANRFALWLLKTLGAEGREAQARLLPMLADEDGSAIHELWEAIRTIGVDGRHVPALVALLDKDARFPAGKAMQLLETLGDAATPAVPALLQIVARQWHPDSEQAAKLLLGLGETARDRAIAALQGRIAELADAGPETDVEPAMVACRNLVGLVLQFESGLPGSVSEVLCKLLPIAIRSGGKDDFDTAECVIAALGRQGRKARAAVPAFVQLLATDRDSDLRVAALAALVDLGPAVAASATPAMVQLLTDDDDLQEAALNALRRFGDAALPAAADGLGDPDPDIRQQCRRLLSRSGPRCVPQLQRVFRYGVWPAPELALELMDLWPDESRVTLESLADSVMSDLREAWPTAHLIGLCQRAGALQARAGFAAPDLVRLIDHADTDVALAAIRALGDIGLAAEATVGALAAHRADEPLRADIERTLVTLLRVAATGADARYTPASWLGLLIDVLAIEDDEHGLRKAPKAARVLLEQIDIGAMEPVVQRLDHPSARVRRSLLRATQHMPLTAAAAPALGRLLVLEAPLDDREGVIRLALQQLGTLQADAAAGLFGVLPLLTADDERIRQMAVDCAARTGSAGLPWLLPALDAKLHPDNLRLAVLEVLALIGPDAAGALDDLTAIACNESAQESIAIRAAACRSLAFLGSGPAAVTRPLLRQLAASNDAALAQAATAALEILDSPGDE